MTRVTYIEPDGTQREVEASPGTTVMEAAVDNGIEGIVAECGGACSCATCHVYVDPEWADRLTPPDAQEDGMLDCVVDRQPNSRLSCQIQLNDELDGLLVRVPDAQL
ncbi:MAG: 2Fe-2S iron-sulfur cluster binding domain-containing protein [Gammaproteobacteria bacterium]|nr:2Fe-2S iron-sulfur cluster binding domain-containing protein [Gammaproteobacteria bacterium]